jgi:hypothetical protein
MACFLKVKFAKPNIMDYFFKSNRVLVWKGSFLKADRVMREIIAKPNHVLFF